MELSGLRYIVVEGVIGVGKTSLARRLGVKLEADLLLEKPTENAFLERFYADPERYALATQMNFLFQRADQVKQLNQLNLFARPVVSDFMLDKDPLFASLTLAEDELALYRRLYGYLKPQAPRPDLVIYLQASVDTLLQRIERRGIRYEQHIERDYLSRLHDAYSHYFLQYDEAPVLLVNTETLNFADSAADFEHLLNCLGTMSRKQMRRQYLDANR